MVFVENFQFLQVKHAQHQKRFVQFIDYIVLTEYQKNMYSKSSNSNHFKLKNQRPLYLIDDDSHDSRAVCTSCVKYEQDINILQEKLMETHNKLIQQIDLCRQQQIKIIKLTSGNKDRDGQNHNILNRQQSGKIFRKNDQQYMQSIQPLIEAKTQLLRNDLQVMRSKVLSQISKCNKLKQENRELEIKHQRELQQYRDKIRKIQNSRNKLVDQNQELQEQNQHLKKNQVKSQKCTCGYEQKYYDLDKAFINQRTVTNQLLEENNKIQAKMQQLYEERAKLPFHEHQSNHIKQENFTQPKKKKNFQRQKFKQQFEATKSLIKKLQQAELQIRNKTNKT